LGIAVSQTKQESFLLRKHATLKQVALYYGAGLDAGTHVNGAGLTGGAHYVYAVDKSPDLSKNLQLGMDASCGSFLKNLGIPGGSFSGRLSFRVGYGFGGKARAFNLDETAGETSKYNLNYCYLVYLTTDGTSQLAGLVGCSFYAGGHRIGITYENDWYGFQFRDQYRTSAVEISWLKSIGHRVAGLYGGFKLWTGQTQNLPGHLDKVFPVDSAFGSAWSHGIVYTACRFGLVRLALGWDSEKVRDILQNTYHRVRGIGKILPLVREDKMYVQVSVGGGSFLF
jgi:hypothetical protein